ncbi:MAG: hypothetical protein GTN35_05315 [Nitrososphaeria archaeon]|nr:hypothetical protein [Nitrosopumilaceae archaeon]NIP09612.1 hypothetical protein [Nitrosopumilaceae archaeon]NIP91795.1 hypothetical protein [Nitrososphaeria archaeon]NIS95854.1 hypothetical protein [Nitrosopumilaceae archaeon]
MDKTLKNKIEEKFQETLSNKEEIQKLLQALSNIDDSKSFVLGVVVGRIYNSFYYQSKRILDREPTSEEFNEFMEYVKSRKSEFEKLW